jgi:hypothetical protein
LQQIGASGNPVIGVRRHDYSQGNGHRGGRTTDFQDVTNYYNICLPATSAASLHEDHENFRGHRMDHQNTIPSVLGPVNPSEHWASRQSGKSQRREGTVLRLALWIVAGLLAAAMARLLLT